MPTDPYDVLAGHYVEHNRTGPYNAYYERPALLELCGDQCGRDVLDLGCGPGVTAAALLGAGARVTALDRSAAMISAAAGLLGDRATLLQHDMNDPLPLPDAAVDTVVAGLSLHYLADWSGPLAEIRRVLRPGGRLVASVHHPMTDRRVPSLAPDGHGDYLDSYPIPIRWSVGAVSASVRFWHHPLGRITGWVSGAGLSLTDLVEPRPVEEMAVDHPGTFAALSAEPAFLLIAATAPG
ncbi:MULTISPECIES: class I SAM-dependent methyltransferase [Pseudonocardia]|uniref:Malonyl-[acyl-carrier protein] O-methyltransferase n=2 Tax=Pseudonocardia TaxID=1847 RepID=A0A1Y2N855_PSEAH|nr:MULTISPECIES: class I SAM-dependent methyltransferase [Pseudonocardia]OSY43118.1 Malonyl-[acyl-carrier protein] O-methyltransferase [Pseudonocardia autotrophica]TDN71606.1 methyltransferase family protein [Pseudonocardia autotrophica]BBG02293.1 methyltransferase [Pseudonocardia autotrophica]GEC23371.1 methyltransferase [Pseudonocardia saturnea]